MSRQPRFADDDDRSYRRRGSSGRPHFEENTAPASVKDTEPEEEAEDIKIERVIDDTSTSIPIPDEGGSKGGGGKKVALLIIAILLGFAIVGAGVYALVHFVLSPQEDNAVDATEFSVATMPEEPTLAPTPTQPPTEAPTESPYDAQAAEYMKDMSVRDKICQLFIVTPEGLVATSENADGIGNVTEAGDTTKKCLEEYPVGGIVYNTANLEDADQTRSMVRNSQRYSKTPLFISVDEEGGEVARVAGTLGSKRKFYPMYTYKDKGEKVAHDVAQYNAFNIRRFGFNMDLAPVADVWSNPKNTVIAKRAYSDDYAQASKLVASAVKGYDDGEVVNVLKHFPGHGGTDEDSHEGLAYVNTSVEDLKKNELQPFKAGIEAGADMVMIGHLVVKELDAEKPATLSDKVVPELLRKELGYDGLVITDSMNMGAITENYDYNTIVKGLFAADVDIILDPDNLEKYVTSIETLLESGDITQEQIDAKVKKILSLKFKQGIIKSDAVTEAAAETTAPTEAPTDTTPVTPTENPTAIVIATDTALPAEQPTVAA